MRVPRFFDVTLSLVINDRLISECLHGRSTKRFSVIPSSCVVRDKTARLLLAKPIRKCDQANV